MKLLSSIIIFAFLVLGARSEEEEKSNVLVLNEENFQSTVNGHEFILVKFYAPWCGHCKAIAPEYEKAANALKEENSPIKLAKVDATVNGDIASKFDVKGYPTLKFFRNGVPVSYTGGRSAEDFVAWLKKKTGPPAKTIATVEELESFKGDKAVVLGYFKDLESDAAKFFLEHASNDDEIEYGVTTSEDVKKAAGVSGEGLVILKPFDDGKSVFDGKLEAGSDLTKWIGARKLPLVNLFSIESSSGIFGGPIKTHLIVFGTEEAYSDFVPILTAVAKKNLGKLLVIYIKYVPEHEQLLEYFNLVGKTNPEVRIVNLADEITKYTGDFTEITEDNLSSLADKYFAGELEQLYASEDVPEDWNKAPVKVLVGKNFDEVTKDQTKNVLVKFYAPWCGHCKALAPIWEELGEKYANHESIVIAKMDATKNEAAGLKVTGFPTIRFYPANSDQSLEFEGDRTLEGFTKYLDEKLVKPTEESEEAHSEL